jgi:hypothetical protein
MVEDRILREAKAEIDGWPEARRNRRGYVVAGAEWHEGVIGIVASRLVERLQPPGGADRGHGRRLEGLRPLDPAFDLHAGLAACSGTSSASAATAPPPASRSARRTSTSSRSLRRLRRRQPRRRRPAAGDRGRPIVRRSRSRSASARS